MHNRSSKKNNDSATLTALCHHNQPSPMIEHGPIATGALATFLTTTAQAILSDILTSRQLNDELIYCANQLLRAGILCGYFDSSFYRVAAAPFLSHYFYQFTKDDRRYEATDTDPTAEAIAALATTAALLGYDICYNTLYHGTPISEATLASCGTVAGNLATQLASRASYQWIKNSLFGSSHAQTKETHTPNSRAWLSLDW